MTVVVLADREDIHHDTNYYTDCRCDSMMNDTKHRHNKLFYYWAGVYLRERDNVYREECNTTYLM